jgi:tripartite-type tricarboxylate transporter receptor subunit TctC
LLLLACQNLTQVFAGDGRMTHSTFTRRHWVGVVSALALGLSSAWADTAYPSKPIRLVVPFPPGGSPDILARTLGQKLTEATGVAVLVDNVPGAGGTLGADRVAKAPADGYTLLMGHVGTLAFAPAIYPQLPYDPIKSFAPVASVARVPNVLAVNPNVPAKNVTELVAYLKQRPGQLNYGSGGNGSAAHLAMEYFKASTETFVVHVPYKGTAPSVTDAVSGQVQMVFTGAPAIIPMAKAGKLKPLGVSSLKRLESLPDVPTLGESGVKGLVGFDADQWYGVVAPAGTPTVVVNKLNQLINASLNSVELRTRLNTEGAFANPTTPEVFGQFIQKEIARWKPVVVRANIKPD